MALIWALSSRLLTRHDDSCMIWVQYTKRSNSKHFQNEHDDFLKHNFYIINNKHRIHLIFGIRIPRYNIEWFWMICWSTFVNVQLSDFMIFELCFYGYCHLCFEGFGVTTINYLPLQFFKVLVLKFNYLKLF